MPNKPTDKEIVKALECCKSDTSVCNECPYDKIGECIEKMCADSIDLINRLQGENERLQGSVDRYNIQVANQREQIEKYEPIKETLCVLWETMSSIGVAKGKEKPTLEELAEAVDHIKSEAYKEFANELKCRTHEISYNTLQVVTEYDIDNLLKELAGEDNESKN